MNALFLSVVMEEFDGARYQSGECSSMPTPLFSTVSVYERELHLAHSVCLAFICV
jgi:hypothetical protein